MPTMKAAICTSYGPPEVLKIEERERPVPKDDELLIKVYATSVTNSDLFIRSSDVPLPMRIPLRIMLGIAKPRQEIIGEVLAGLVEEVGPAIRRFRVGDRVYGLTGFSLGAYADYKCMKERDSKRGCVAIMPANIGYEEATAAAYGGLLALQFMEGAEIGPGRKVLIYGAAGTSGTIAIQYAKQLGAEVSAACSAEKAELAKSLGADKVLDYKSPDSLSRLEAYDFVLDAVGKRRSSELKEACKRSLSGRGSYASIDDGPLLLDSSRLARIAKLVEAGAMKPVTDRCFPFERIVEAHRYVELGRKAGNVAVTVNGP